MRKAILLLSFCILSFQAAFGESDIKRKTFTGEEVRYDGEMILGGG